MTEVDKRKLPFPAKEDLLLQKFELRDEVEKWAPGRTIVPWIGFGGTVAQLIFGVFFAPPDLRSYLLVIGVVWIILIMLNYWYSGRKLRQAEQALASVEAFAPYAKIAPEPEP
jgi:hypothetical protein